MKARAMTTEERQLLFFIAGKIAMGSPMDDDDTKRVVRGLIDAARNSGQIGRLKELLRLALACENDEAGWRADAAAELAK